MRCMYCDSEDSTYHGDIDAELCEPCYSENRDELDESI